MPFNKLIVIGFFCVLIGAVLPFLMVMRMVESTFLLNFIAYTTSMAGIFLGVLGAALHIGEERGKQRKDNWWDNSH